MCQGKIDVGGSSVNVHRSVSIDRTKYVNAVIKLEKFMKKMFFKGTMSPSLEHRSGSKRNRPSKNLLQF